MTAARRGIPVGIIVPERGSAGIVQEIGTRAGPGAAPAHGRFRGALTTLTAVGAILALTACSHAMPDDSSRRGTATDGDDPWIIRGSVSGGPMHGTPPGPYSPR
jgi:hypothetical protein